MVPASQDHHWAFLPMRGSPPRGSPGFHCKRSLHSTPHNDSSSEINQQWRQALLSRGSYALDCGMAMREDQVQGTLAVMRAMDMTPMLGAEQVLIAHGCCLGSRAVRRCEARWLLPAGPGGAPCPIALNLLALGKWGSWAVPTVTWAQPGTPSVFFHR